VTIPIGKRQQATVYYGCQIRNMAAITLEDGPRLYEMNTATKLEDTDIPVSFFVNRHNPQCVDKYIDRVQSAYDSWRMFGDQARDDTNSIAMDLDHSRVRSALQEVVTEQLGYKRQNKVFTQQGTEYGAPSTFPNAAEQQGKPYEGDADEAIPYMVNVLQEAGFVFGTVAECLGFWAGSLPGATEELWGC